MTAFNVRTTSLEAGWQQVSPARNAPAFRLQSALSGKHIRLGDIDSLKTLLTFVPGIWAPWCRQLLDQLSAVVPDLEELGVSLVAIVSQDWEQLSDYVSERELGYEVLADPHGVISTRYGIFDENIQEPMKISKPAIFLLDFEKNLHYKFLGRHLADRPGPQEILQVAAQKLPTARRSRTFPLSLKRLFYAGN